MLSQHSQWSGEQIPEPHFDLKGYLCFTSILHLFLPLFNLFLTPAQLAISNHSLETTVYKPLVRANRLRVPDLEVNPFFPNRVVGH